MPDWICGTCGREAGAHSDPKSPSFKCLWVPVDTDTLVDRH